MRFIATTKDQSQRLLECGINPKTSDLWLILSEYKPYYCVNTGTKPGALHIPAWSLTALLALIPARIYPEKPENEEPEDEYPYDEESEEPMYDQYWFALAKMDFKETETDEYEVQYTPASLAFQTLVDFRLDSPIEACVCMVEWLVKNDYKLNEIEKGVSHEED